MKKINGFLKTRKIYIIAVVVLFIIYKAFGTSNSDISNTYKIKTSELAKSVTVSGKVVASQSVNMAFVNSGTVSTVYKNVGDKVSSGDLIASIDSSELRASRDKAYADLLAAKAELLKTQNTANSDSDVQYNKREIVSSIIDAYTKSDDAIHIKIDQYFRNPRSPYPEIQYLINDYFSVRETINKKRAVVEDVLVKWQRLVLDLNESNYTAEKLALSQKYFSTVQDFIETISPAVSSFDTASQLTQTQVDRYKSDFSTIRTNLNTALVNLNSSQNKLRTSISDTSVLEAKVASAQANLNSYEVQLSKTSLFAPFSGVVSLQDAKIGQTVTTHEKIATIISDKYQIEVYIPELYILDIKENASANITFDAERDNVRQAIVTKVDPAETIREGVATYKVTLSLNESNASISNIRPGMSADVEIFVFKNTNALVIPTRAIITDTNSKENFVFIKKSNGEMHKTQIKIVANDGKGNTQIEWVDSNILNDGPEIFITL